MKGRSGIRLAIVAAGAAMLFACGKKVEKRTSGDESLGLVSLETVAARQDPSAASPLVATLKRGMQVKAGPVRSGYVSVILANGARAWIPQGSFERTADLQWRQERTKEVQSFEAQPGRTIERAVIFLAPDYGAAQWGELAAGSTVDVLVPRGDFFGMRLPGLPLGFVPSRSVQLVAPAPTPTPEPETQEEGESPGTAPKALPRDVKIPAAPEREAVAKPTPQTGPYETLPEGAERPILKKEVRPRYPEGARRAGVQGMVILRILVKRDGTVGSVQILRDLPMGLGQLAADAVKEYEYEPAKVQGVPVDVFLTTTVRFTLGAP